MRNNGLKYAGFIFVAVVIGIGVGWIASRPKTVEPTPISTEPEASHAANSSAFTKTSRVAAAAETPETALVPAPELIVDWPDKISDVLVADTEIPEKCKVLLEMFPKLPLDGQVEAAQHLSNLVGNDEYQPLGKILLDPKTPDAVDSVLIMDVYNRPASTRLPILLQVARTPNHPKAAEAKDLLERFLDEDYGTDWTRWENKMTAWLKENPD